MYEEEKKISVRNLILTILLIALIVCVLLWIFNRKNNNNNTVKPVEVNYSSKIDTNVKILENAGKAYYYKAALPTNVNNTKQATLRTLIDSRMLNVLYDENGNECDRDASYVLLTKKNDNEFDLKSHIRCGIEERNINTTLYCSDTKSNCKVEVAQATLEPTVEEPAEQEPVQEPVEEKVSYKYLYVCEEHSKKYGDWSKWSKTKVESSKTREVQTKKKTEQVYTKIGTREEAVTTYETQTIIETHVEEQRFVNTKPANAKSCYAIPKADYTIYVCQVEVKRAVQVQVPVVTYHTVDVYGYKDVTVKYYRYRSVKDVVKTTEKWSTDINDKELRAKGCMIKQAIRITK